MPEKKANVVDRFKAVAESNPYGAASLAMGAYFGGRIGHAHGATAAGVAGGVAGTMAADAAIRGVARRTRNPYALIGATIGSAMLPIYTSQIAARVAGRDPREVAMMRSQGHKLASWDAGVVDGLEKTAAGS